MAPQPPQALLSASTAFLNTECNTSGEKQMLHITSGNGVAFVEASPLTLSWLNVVQKESSLGISISMKA
jgi:hypothetical protein